MRNALAVVALGMMVNTLAADEKPADRWEPVRVLLGNWQGEASGDPGKGVVERSYGWTLGGKFIEEHNTSSYEARDGKPAEIHHHRGFFSYDRARGTVMLRHFHEEGFINLYALSKSASSSKRLVFESVSFENFSNEWKARETYDIVSSDEFIETFELAEPGKEFVVYSRNHFKRKPG